MDFPACRHAEAIPDADLRHCHSPRLIGWPEVSRGFCQRCFHCDHPLDEAAASPSPPRLLDCAYLGHAPAHAQRLPCRHERHDYTTREQCAACPDYLFPLVTPSTPVEQVQQIIAQPPREQHDDWARWENVQEAHRRAASRYIARIPPWDGRGRGRGIVVVGGGKYLVSAYVTIRVLRHVGCRLPIELWHTADEVDDGMRRELAAYGVRCIDADAVAQRHPFRFLHGHWWKGWQLKPFALRYCSFREVLLLDADCYPVRNPEFLFHWPTYCEWGSVFWPDVASSVNLLPPAVWPIFAAQWPGDNPTESGQLLLNKQLCWRELHLALHYNAQADYTYRLVWGDKDTFPLAWSRLGRRYARMWPGCGYQTVAILQFDDRGEVLFQHRVHDKFRLGGVRFQSTPQPELQNRFVPQLQHEEFCFSVLNELARHWAPADQP